MIDCLGIPYDQVEKIMKHRREFKNITKSKADLYLNELLKHQKQILEKQKKNIDYIQSFQNNTDDLDTSYNDILQSIKNNIQFFTDKKHKNIMITI